MQKDAALWRVGTIMVGGVIAHPFAKLLWIGLMPDVDAYAIEHMHCLTPTPTSRSAVNPLIATLKPQLEQRTII